MSFFERDLTKEKLLASFLDATYAQLHLKFERIYNLRLQKKGVDLVYVHKGKRLYIDEKAQLDYINTTLPTFTFELSYLKNGIEKVGWLLDENKITTHYFLIVGIYAIDKSDLQKGFTKVKIISVDRTKLLIFLDNIGLTSTQLKAYNQKLRVSENCERKTAVDELFMNTQGCLFYSNQLDEKPINLQLRLKFLIENEIGKVIYPLQNKKVQPK